jgi:hypothetical protein
MNRKRFEKIVLFSVLIIVAGVVFYLYGSRRANCLSELYVAEFFIAKVRQETNYCKYYKRAYSGDYESFKKMLDFGFDAGAACEHGYVINSIIDNIGQEKIIEWFKKGELDKVVLWGWVRIGVEWGLPNEEGKKIPTEDKYPLLFEFLDLQDQY